MLQAEHQQTTANPLNYREILRKKELLRETETAWYIDMSVSWVRKSRMNGRRLDEVPPPPFLRFGRAVRYRVADLDAWLEARQIQG